MMITKHNFEAYMLDWMEGKLSDQEVRALQLFLDDHPDLDAALPEEIVLSDAAFLSDEEKDSLLYQNIDERNRSYFFIAYVEGMLDENQMKAVETFVARSPVFDKEFNQFKRTLLPMDTTVLFTDKHALVQPIGGALDWWTNATRAAAIIVLLIGSYWLFLQTDDVAPRYTQSYKYATEYFQEQLAIDTLPDEQVVQVRTIQTLQLLVEHDNMTTEISSEEQRLEIAETVDAKSSFSIDTLEFLSPNITEDAIADISVQDPIVMEVKQHDFSKTSAEMHSHPAIPRLDEWAISKIEQRARLSSGFPDDIEFENSLYSLASLGLSALTKQQQSIGSKQDDYRKTRVEIGGLKFERTVFVGRN
jgi:hypothetical protein